MRVNVKQWGNSAAIRIPSAILQAAHLALDQEVELWEENGRIVIEPARAFPYKLDELVSGINDENRHMSVDFGNPQGKEAW